MASGTPATSRPEGGPAPGIDRRAPIGIGPAAGLGTQLPAARATPAGFGAFSRIDAHTHFAPLKFLDFAERAEGRPFPLGPLYRSKPALTAVGARIDLLDRNEVDINVLIP